MDKITNKIHRMIVNRYREYTDHMFENLVLKDIADGPGLNIEIIGTIAFTIYYSAISSKKI